MLVVDSGTGEIVQAAGDTPGLLGQPLDALLGRRAESLLQPNQVSLLRDLSGEVPLTTPRHFLDPTLRVTPDRPPPHPVDVPVLPKPFGLDELKHRVERLVAASRDRAPGLGSA